MYRDGTLEELIKDLEEERASKRLRELDPELLLKPDIWLLHQKKELVRNANLLLKNFF